MRTAQTTIATIATITQTATVEYSQMFRVAVKVLAEMTPVILDPAVAAKLTLTGLGLVGAAMDCTLRAGLGPLVKVVPTDSTANVTGEGRGTGDAAGIRTKATEAPAVLRHAGEYVDKVAYERPRRRTKTKADQRRVVASTLVSPA